MQQAPPAHKTHPRRFLPRGLLVRHAGLGFAILHLAVALEEYRRGLCFRADPERAYWNWFWQAIPVEDLLSRPWTSFWHLHAQPPGFSLWGLVWLKALGRAHFLDAIQVGYAILGAGVVAMTYHLALRLTRSRGWAAVAGAAMALNPALFLYEAYLLYEPLVIFLVVASAACLWKALAARRGPWLALFALCLVALVMTRSLYHLVFLVGALAFAWPLWRMMRPLRRWSALALVVALPFLWYCKNAVQYGFFGASSWHGIGLFKCVIAGYRYDELVDLARRGVIPQYVQLYYPFQHPPSVYRPYGFTRQSDVPLLSRDEFHNVNIPALSRAFERAAVTLICLHPLHYARAVLDSYVKFSRPPSRFLHLGFQRAVAVGWEPIVARWLYGQGLTDWVELTSRREFGSLYFFYHPLLLGFGLAWALRRRGEIRRRRAQGAPIPASARARPAVMLYMLFVSVYVTAIGCLFENGENERFRFAIEPFMLVMALAALQPAAARLGPPVARWLRRELASSRKSPGP